MTAAFVFSCSICGEPSQSICVYCTKDACANHLCERCHRCSDCCECEVRLDEHPGHEHAAVEVPPAVPPELAVEEGPEAPVEEAEAAVPVESAPEPAEPEVAEPEPPVEEAPLPVEFAVEPAPAGDLSKLFAPELEPRSADAAVPLFAPEPVQTDDAESQALPQAPEGDWSKLFAPEDEPGKPVFPTSRALVPSPAEPEGSEETKPEDEPEPESGNPT